MKVIAITPDKKEDYLTSCIVEGLYKNHIEVIATDYGNNIREIFSDKEIIKHSKNADFILAFFGKVRGNRPPKYYLLEKINRPDLTAYIDGSEWTYTAYKEKNQKKRKGNNWINQEMYNYCKWYFKRECYPEDAKLGIIPLIFSAVEKNFRKYHLKKEIDVLCSFGQVRTGLRKKVENYCRKLQRRGFKVVIGHNYKYSEYLKLISLSYITIDALGGGDCCTRFWEIIANKSCCVSQKYKILFPDKFTDGHDFVEYSSIKEFKKKLNYYLNNREICLKIAERGYQHLLKFHTSKERVNYLLSKMKEITF